MSPSPTANRSFLHSHKAALISDKVVYATLDSLALKQARLPLQLLPVNNDDIDAGKTDKVVDKEKRPTCGKTASKRSACKVKSGVGQQWKSYSKYLVFSSAKPQNQPANNVATKASLIDGRHRDHDSDRQREEITTTRRGGDLRSTGAAIPSIDEESKDPPGDDVGDSTHSEKNSRDDADTVDRRRRSDKGKYPISRKDSGSSGDYEKMNVTNRKAFTLERTAPFVDAEILRKTTAELAARFQKFAKNSPLLRKKAAKSKSVDDLTSEVTYEVIHAKQPETMTTSDEEDATARQQVKKKKKKKRRFTRNVLHYVPAHLVKQPKKKKKKLTQKKYALSSSLSSLRSLHVSPWKAAQSFGLAGSPSREDRASPLKSVTISPPTNFVHLASATNPGLVANESTVRSGIEQLVITHQQVCATLSLVGEQDEPRTSRENENADRLKVAAGILPVVDNSQASRGGPVVESVADKSERTNYAEIKSDRPKDARSRAAKVLETSQPVKIALGNQADSPEGETYEPVCESSSPRANSSFLWGCQVWAKTSPGDAARENGEDADSEEYDDVGPSNFAAQAESDYDDVGPPTARELKELAAKDCEEIYDDVMPAGFKPETTTPVDNSDYLIPETVDETPGSLEQPVQLRVAKASHLVAPSNDQYFSTNNEYSSVDEAHLGEEARDELGVYDDVGLPGEERVNSLYAGSTPGSVLGLTSMNGKESEWEDVEEFSSVSRCPCRGNDPCEKKSEAGQQQQQQVAASSVRKKFVQRWSRKARRQRSRRSRRSMKATATRTALDAKATSQLVAVSLGCGSILLIGESHGVAEEWRMAASPGEEDRASCRTQGLVQLRVVNLDEDVDIQETSCYVHEDSASEDSTYESLYSCQPEDDFSTDSEAESRDTRRRPSNRDVTANNRVITYECPTRPTPPPPREASLTQTLGRRIKILRRTWSITKGSLGRIRRRTSVDESFDEKEQSGNEHPHLPPHRHTHQLDTGKYFNFRRRFRKSIVDPPTFYLDENGREDVCSVGDNNNGIVKETIYTNSQYMGGSSSSDDSSRNSTVAVDHYSVLADQEPLYQFYAAAVARVAFESDSEGYEEVEDTIRKTCPAATDLSRSGQRMLWCHTPQVRHSGLVENLSTEEKKIQEAKFEILTSEASYLNSLRVLENEFLRNHALMNDILSPIERRRLFGGVPSVLSASQAFLAELEAVWREDPMLLGLSEVLLKHAEKCQATYVAYCSNQVSIDTTLKELRARKGVKFLEAVKRIEMRPACQNLSLHSFLMLPMQRVTRLPLLADAVVSKLSMGNPDRTSWEKVLSSLSNVVAECNEGARTATQEAEMEALARKLEYSTKVKPIVLRGKQLVRSGSVVQLSTKTDTEYRLTFGKKFNKTPLYLLLLTDYLLVTKLKSNAPDESYTVIDACKRNLLALESACEESPFAGRNAMILTLLENHSGRHVEYVLTCENNTERERWLEAVSPPKRGLIGETLYESWDCPQVMAKHPYSPNQPDELSLQPGDVINVLRKMADGWYHGEKLLDGVQGWFPANHTKEIASEHIRARNLKQRHRLLALSNSVIQQRRAKQNGNL